MFDYMTDGWVAMDDVSLTGPRVTKYYYLGGQRVAIRQGGVLTYLHGDHLGSASLATDVSGAQVSEQRYLPYGGTRPGFTGSGLPTDRQYTGQRREASLGFYDYVARQFDPALGRFLQADSIIPNPGNPQSLNRYSYVLNSPLRYTDPSGHRACGSFDAAGKCIPLPKMPTFWVSFAGNWDTTSQYAVQAGAEDVGSALAGAMNFGRHQDNLAARKSGDPLIPRGRVTAKQAFYRTYGNITFVRKSPGTVDGWGWSQVGSRGEIWIDAVGNTGYWKYGRQNTAHELGHGLAQLTGWDRARGNYNAYADIASAQIVVDGEVLRMGFQRQSWRGYQLVQGRTWPWQQNTASTPNEEFADMFLGWVYNGFASDSFGAARYNWMATNMAEWIALASQ